MSYLVVKQSGSNKSFELKTSVPAKPYMAVKTAVAGTAYLALGTNTTGAGMLVKGANQNYKVVESYTTTTDRSSTYNSYYQTTSTSYYTDTTTINSTSLESFTYNLAYSISVKRISVTVSASIDRAKTHSNLRICFNSATIASVSRQAHFTCGSFSEIYQRVYRILDLVVLSNTTKGFDGIILRSNSGALVVDSTYLWHQGFSNDSMLCKITSVSPIINTRQKQYGGILVSASAETGQTTRPSDPYQTYSEATSYYTETITVQ